MNSHEIKELIANEIVNMVTPEFQDELTRSIAKELASYEGKVSADAIRAMQDVSKLTCVAFGQVTAVATINVINKLMP